MAINIGILGFGTVAQGIVEVLYRNQSEISRRAGKEINIVGVFVRHTQRDNRYNVPFFTDADALIHHPDVNVIIEVMGGIEPASTYIHKALRAGKHVITANKALLATQGNEIFELARELKLIVAYEAAVAGGIPVIKTLREGLAGNRIEWLAGIINGTSNFILTEMHDKKRSFSEALSEAQALGYAEADPTFDVEGIDAAHKLTILASLAFGIPLQFTKVGVEGISKVEACDITYAKEFGYVIKHLGIARKQKHGIELRVSPTLIPKRRLLANVDGVMNAVLVKGDAVGPILLYGAGAGAEPTASAVVADLIDVARLVDADIENYVPSLAFQQEHIADLPLLSETETISAYYLRIQAIDKPGVLANITQILGHLDISIEAMMQKESLVGEWANILIMTHRTHHSSIIQALAEIEALATVQAPVRYLRVESFWGS